MVDEQLFDPDAQPIDGARDLSRPLFEFLERSSKPQMRMGRSRMTDAWRRLSPPQAAQIKGFLRSKQDEQAFGAFLELFTIDFFARNGVLVTGTTDFRSCPDCFVKDCEGRICACETTATLEARKRLEGQRPELARFLQAVWPRCRESGCVLYVTDWVQGRRSPSAKRFALAWNNYVSDHGIVEPGSYFDLVPFEWADEHGTLIAGHAIRVSRPENKTSLDGGGFVTTAWGDSSGDIIRKIHRKLGGQHHDLEMPIFLLVSTFEGFGEPDADCLATISDHLSDEWAAGRLDRLCGLIVPRNCFPWSWGEETVVGLHHPSYCSAPLPGVDWLQ